MDLEYSTQVSTNGIQQNKQVNVRTVPDSNININTNRGTGYPANESLQLQEGLSSTAAFNLTDRLQIFSYLVSSNRIRWYRVIMRVFLQHHHDLYHYQLTAQEVRDAVRAALDPEYSLEQCQNDLAALKEWGNITTIYDSSRATSIASFLSPACSIKRRRKLSPLRRFLKSRRASMPPKARCVRATYLACGPLWNNSMKTCKYTRLNCPLRVAPSLKSGNAPSRYGTQ